MPRQAGLGTPGTLHHVVIRCIEQRKIVADNIDRRNFVDRMGYLSSETDTVIYAWVSLANHTHILLRSDLLGLLGSYQRSGKSAPKKLVLPAHLFSHLCIKSMDGLVINPFRKPHIFHTFQFNRFSHWFLFIQQNHKIKNASHSKRCQEDYFLRKS